MTISKVVKKLYTLYKTENKYKLHLRLISGIQRTYMLSILFILASTYLLNTSYIFLLLLLNRLIIIIALGGRLVITSSEMGNHAFLSDGYKNTIDSLTSICDPFFWNTPVEDGLKPSPDSYCLSKVELIFFN